jgi:hypothetical protein
MGQKRKRVVGGGECGDTVYYVVKNQSHESRGIESRG